MKLTGSGMVIERFYSSKSDKTYLTILDITDGSQVRFNYPGDVGVKLGDQVDVEASINVRQGEKGAYISAESGTIKRKGMPAQA